MHRKEIGPNYFVSYLIKPLNNISSSSSLSIHFCNHCEVMAHTIRKLSDTRYHLESEIEECRKKMIAFEIVSI